LPLLAAEELPYRPFSEPQRRHVCAQLGNSLIAQLLDSQRELSRIDAEDSRQIFEGQRSGARPQEPRGGKRPHEIERRFGIGPRTIYVWHRNRETVSNRYASNDDRKDGLRSDGRTELEARPPTG
jgi:hypothetical protein